MVFSFLQGLLLPSLVLLAVPLYLYITTMRSKHPVDWPVVGTLHTVIAKRHNLHDYVHSILAANNYNKKLQGLPYRRARFFFTSEPANVRHMFISNFANYTKGEEFAAIFDTMGDGFFNVDGNSWRSQRALALHVLSRPALLTSMAQCCRYKVEEGLLSVLSHAANTGAPFDLADVFGRLVLDLTTMLVFGVDTGSLSVDDMMPPVPVASALDAVMEVAFFRHIVPTACWKTVRWLGIPPERKLATAQKLLRVFTSEMILQNKAEQRRRHASTSHGAAATEDSILACYMKQPDHVNVHGEPNELLRCVLLTYMIAGRDTVGATLPWLMYNLARNPRTVSRIREELAPIASCKATTATMGATSRGEAGTTAVVFEPDETKCLVYLRAALFESMRLYPPVPYERKEVLAGDTMPSGDVVRVGDIILISIYSMGRVESVWGNDSHVYRPERWLSRDGTRLQFMPSYKFMAFNSGPRTCPGKDMAITQMTTIAAAVVWNFDVELLEGHAVVPKLSGILQMKNGLMVKVRTRQGKY